MKLLAVVLLSVLVAVYAFEGWLSLQPSPLSRENELIRLRAEGRDAVLSVPPRVWYFEHFRKEIDAGTMPLALGGVSNADTALCKEAGPAISYKADAFGFRSGGSGDVFLTGDSFAQGVCVPDSDTISARLNARSFGMAGDGPLFELATLIEYVLPQKPRAVVWLFYEGNDLADIQQEATSSLLMRYLDGRPRGIDQSAIDKSLRGGMIALSQERSNFLRLYRVRAALGLTGLRLDREARPPVDTGLFAKVIETARTATSNAGARFLFVYLPAAERFLDASDYYAAIERDVLAIVPDAVRPDISLADYAKLTNKYGHFTPAGYQRVADAIARALQ